MLDCLERSLLVVLLVEGWMLRGSVVGGSYS